MPDLLVLLASLAVSVGVTPCNRRAKPQSPRGVCRTRDRRLQIDRSGLFFVAFLPNIQILGGEVDKNYPRWGQFSLSTTQARQAPKIRVL